MKKPRSLSDVPAPAVSLAAPRLTLSQAWVRFWFSPRDPLGLHVVRVLAGMLVLTWLLAFAGQQDAFFGLGGWFDRQAYIEAGRLPGGTPAPVSWSVLYLAGTDPTALAVLYWSSIVAVALFTLGVFPRLTGVLTWVVVASFTANPAIAYDADSLLLVLTFYLMIGYLLLGLTDRTQPPLRRLLGPLVVWPPLLGRGRETTPQQGGEPRASVAANLALRLLQVHFALILCVSGFHKLQFAEWWGGVNFWYALYPPLETTVAEARTHAGHAQAYLAVLSLGAYLALAWQLGFPFFAWRPRWRVVLLGGAVAGWLATALMYRLPLFGPAFFIGALCFLTPAEWQRAAGWLYLALDRLRQQGAVPKEAVPTPATAARAR